METFIAIDIFDTKGTEYIFVIGYLLLLVAFWQIFWKPARITRKVKQALGSLSASILRIPQGLFFGKNHTWTHLDRSGVASVGLDDLLQHITGDVEFHHHKKPGEQIRKGELLTAINHNGNTLKISSPISGNILNTNSLLKDQKSALSEDPYGKAERESRRPAQRGHVRKPSDRKARPATRPR